MDDQLAEGGHDVHADVGALFDGVTHRLGDELKRVLDVSGVATEAGQQPPHLPLEQVEEPESDAVLFRLAAGDARQTRLRQRHEILDKEGQLRVRNVLAQDRQQPAVGELVLLGRLVARNLQRQTLGQEETRPADAYRFADGVVHVRLVGKARRRAQLRHRAQQLHQQLRLRLAHRFDQRRAQMYHALPRFDVLEA